MKKLLFNTLSKQIKELEKTAKNTILALLNEIPNKTYQTDKIDEEKIIITYDNEKFAFVGCYIDKTKGTFTYNLHDGLKLLGYKIINDDDMNSYRVTSLGSGSNTDYNTFGSTYKHIFEVTDIANTNGSVSDPSTNYVSTATILPQTGQYGILLLGGILATIGLGIIIKKRKDLI